ncbi:MAG: zf-HC2 domain-containing protein [Acidimicrobiales bacterium]|nr:zf-HC2 domain-containing protein [Acidimicrobiales bacterium]
MAVMRCEQLRDMAPDVALGLLTGRERAAALAHLERCETCRTEVAALAGTADELLLAAPEATPPDGFAAGVLARLAAEEPVRDAPGAPAPIDGDRGARPSGRRRMVVAAVAAVVVLVVGGLAVALRSDGGAGTEVAATAVMRTGQGQVVGEATVSGDAPAAVEIDVPGWDAMVDRWGGASEAGYLLAVETSDGERTVKPAPGAGDDDGWSVTVDAPAGDVTTVSVLDDEGRVWCSGRFRAG